MLLPLLIFLAVTLGLAGVWMLFTPNATQQRLQAMQGPARKSDWMASMVEVMGPLAKLSAPTGEWDSSPLRLRFLHAGIRRPQAHLIYFGCKTGLPLLIAGFAWLWLDVFTRLDGLNLAAVLLTLALIGCYLPNLVLWMAVRGRKREIFENFPDATDLMLVCVEAGLGMDAALAKVTDEIRLKSMALAEELHLTTLEMRAGASREQALRNLALRTGVEEVGTFATMLLQADRFGTSVGDSLRVFSDDLRHRRQSLAEEKAAKVPTKLLFPLVTCIFPAIIMVVLGPSLVRVVRVIFPMISHGAA